MNYTANIPKLTHFDSICNNTHLYNIKKYEQLFKFCLKHSPFDGIMIWDSSTKDWTENCPILTLKLVQTCPKGLCLGMSHFDAKAAGQFYKGLC